MTIADAHFAIGKTHEVCQDYGLAVSSTEGYPALAVLSDGCSASPDTDWGARFLARVAVDVAKGGPFNPMRVILGAQCCQKVAGISEQALDATLMVVTETAAGDAEVIVYGDGVVAARRRDGSGYDSWALSYSLNAPAYLSYLLDPDRLALYRNMGGGILAVVTNKGTADARCPPERVGHPEEVMPDSQPSFHRVFFREVYDVVLVLSDGAESFQRREGTRFIPVPLADVLDQVFDFKTLTPGFIKRRVGRFLSKFCPQNEWQHNDDLSVAGLVLDPPGSTTEPQA